MRQLRVLILNWRYLGHPKSGGAEFWTQRLAEELVERGHRVTVFTASVDGCPPSETINGVSVIRRGGQYTVYRHARQFLLSCAGSFDIALDEVNTRPFFAHRYFSGATCAMFHQIADEVWNFEAPLGLRTIGRRVLEPRWIREFSGQRVLVLSESTADSLVQFGVHDTTVVHPGVERQTSNEEVRPHPPTICFLGRLVKSKRPLDAVTAFSVLQRVLPEARMYVIGDGPLRPEIERLRIPSLTVTGRLSAKMRDEILASSDLLLATSVREGWGMNVTEAAEFGVFTIGYDVPGLRDSISTQTRRRNAQLFFSHPKAETKKAQPILGGSCN
jgi:glycosyltransferase involved in cell wall biosynthesis